MCPKTCTAEFYAPKTILVECSALRGSFRRICPFCPLGTSWVQNGDSRGPHVFRNLHHWILRPKKPTSQILNTQGTFLAILPFLPPGHLMGAKWGHLGCPKFFKSCTVEFYASKNPRSPNYSTLVLTIHWLPFRAAAGGRFGAEGVPQAFRDPHIRILRPKKPPKAPISRNKGYNEVLKIFR